ncbi:hypothetical protein N9L31_00320 [bacterium]|nr:hypothetical protein [bacterium]
MGAVAEDVSAASATRHKSRARVGINTIGWRIWPHNYGKWMTQLDPMATSIGRWRVGDPSNLLGQNTRQTVPGKNMSFVLAPGLFTGAPPGAAKVAAAAATTAEELHVRVGFYDEGHGGWALKYASAGGGMKLAAQVQKHDTREFVEIRLSLSDLDLGVGHTRRPGPEHFTLVDTDAVEGSGGAWASSDL